MNRRAKLPRSKTITRRGMQTMLLWLWLVAVVVVVVLVLVLVVVRRRRPCRCFLLPGEITLSRI